MIKVWILAIKRPLSVAEMKRRVNGVGISVRGKRVRASPAAGERMQACWLGLRALRPKMRLMEAVRKIHISDQDPLLQL